MAALFIVRRFRLLGLATYVNAKHFYPIGRPGTAWGEFERAAWIKHAGTVQRSYDEEVVARLAPLRETFDVVQYGALQHDPERYPLFCVKTRKWDASKPCLLVTGGVHGYETSGVQGALLFLATKANTYSERFNIAVCPCVCPWGYETIQRWTHALWNECPQRSARTPCASMSSMQIAHEGAGAVTELVDELSSRGDVVGLGGGAGASLIESASASSSSSRLFIVDGVAHTHAPRSPPLELVGASET